MEFKYEDETLINKEINKFNKDYLKGEYNTLLNIFTAAPEFDDLHSIRHLDLKKEKSKKDHYSIKLNETRRVLFKKVNKESIILLSLV